LTKLRSLDMSYCKGLNSVSFAKSMPKLRFLDISNTQVADLNPLEGLPELTTVMANMTPVGKLPAKVPGLRELSVVSSKLHDPDVLTFEKANPKCQVRHHWNDSLREVLKTATRLRIRSGGTCHRNVEAEKTLFEAKDAGEI